MKKNIPQNFVLGGFYAKSYQFCEIISFVKFTLILEISTILKMIRTFKFQLAWPQPQLASLASIPAWAKATTVFDLSQSVMLG